MELDVYHIACLLCQVIHIVRDLDVRQNSVADVAWATRESLSLENVCSVSADWVLSPLLDYKHVILY